MARNLPGDTIRVLDHGFVRLDDAMASDLSVANAARVSFARRKDEMDESDVGLVGFLMRDRHGTPFEHNAFRFHIRCPLFVAREWFRHRIGCLTGDAVVTFVDTNGHATPKLAKTIDELWTAWTEGQANGNAPDLATRKAAAQLLAEGASQREVARTVEIGRRAVRRIAAGERIELRDARSRIRGMRLRVLDETTGEFTTGHVSDIVDKGVQPVYTLTLADGKPLTLTENHRVLTGGGWMTMGEAVGLKGAGADARMTRACSLMANGVVAYRSREWLREQRRLRRSVGEMAIEAGCSYHTIRKWLRLHDLQHAPGEAGRGRTPWNKGRSYRTGRTLTDEHRAAIRKARSGKNSNFWRGGATSERASVAAWSTQRASAVHAQYDYTCQECGRRGGRLHAHHIAPVWLRAELARSIGNLISLCETCHRAVHTSVRNELAFAERHATTIGFAVELDEVPTRRGVRLVAHAVPVVSLEYVGLRQTFDLCVDGPWHNFVANGIVVHNSFNEFSMRYAKATDEFYVPEAEDVRSQVGKPGAYSFEPVDAELAERTREELQAVYDVAYATYERLVEAGVARELARAVIPVGAYTEFYWTVNARSVMNFVSLRAADTAQREIRRYADAVERLFAEKMPVTHAAFVANDRTAP